MRSSSEIGLTKPEFGRSSDMRGVIDEASRLIARQHNLQEFGLIASLSEIIGETMKSTELCILYDHYFLILNILIAASIAVLYCMFMLFGWLRGWLRG